MVSTKAVPESLSEAGFFKNIFMKKYILPQEIRALLGVVTVIILFFTFKDMGLTMMEGKDYWKQILFVVCYIAMIWFTFREVKKAFF